VNFTAYSMLTRDGRRLVSRLENGREVFELVPESDLPADLPPVREWKLYCVRSTHTDIGLHNPPYIQRHGSVVRTDLARKLVAAEPDDTDPAAFRYTLEGYWFFHNYPMDKGEAATRSLVANEMRRGRIGTSALCAGNHTHVYGYEELCRSAYTRKIYEERWGLAPKTMFMADNPGVAWSVVQPYVEAGIENLLFMPNQWNPLPSTITKMDRTVPGCYWNPDAGGGGSRIDVRWNSPLPMVFWWLAPDGVSKLLTAATTLYSYGGAAFGMCPEDGPATLKTMESRMPRILKKLDARYPYDVWIFAQYGDDEPPGIWASDLFKTWNAKWRWPEMHTAGNPDEAFDQLRTKWGDCIPTISGEMTSGWLQHAASTPELLAQKFAADRALAAAEASAAVDAATRGAPFPGEEFRRAYWALILNDEHSYGTSGYQGRRVYETWLQHRDWIEKAQATANRPGDAFDAAVRGLEPIRGTAENAWYRVVVADGVLTSVYDKELGRELLDGPANRFLYTRDNHRTWEADPARALGAEMTQTVRLAPHAKQIYVETSFRHARDLLNDDRYYRYGYLAFPFAVPGGEFFAQLNGAVMRPYLDLTGHCTDAYVGAREWVAVENGAFGVALVQFDSSLVECGEIHPDRTCYTGAAPKGKSAIYSYLFTDWLQMHQPDGAHVNPAFRYVITSYAGNWKDAHLPATVERTVNPELAGIAGRHVHAEAPNVLLAGLKVAEDGKGLIARFREAEGRRTTTRIVQDLIPGGAVTRNDVLERPWTGHAAGELELLPYQFVTVRIDDGRAIPFAAAKDDGYRYTELVTRPRATHGERDGQLYLEWGVDPSPDFDHFELWRQTGANWAKIADVKPEVHDGLPYCVNRLELLAQGSHVRVGFKIRPVDKNGRSGAFSEVFWGETREMPALARVRVVANYEAGRIAVRYDGATLESWIGGATGGEAVASQAGRGGVAVCWPWCGEPPREGLPRDGLARQMRWELVQRHGKWGLEFELKSSAETRKIWPHAFNLRLRVQMHGESTLVFTVTEENTGETPFETAWGLLPAFRLDGRAVDLTSDDATEWRLRLTCAGDTQPMAAVGPCTHTQRTLAPHARRVHALTASVPGEVPPA
jgi:hypothetical protein